MTHATPASLSEPSEDRPISNGAGEDRTVTFAHLVEDLARPDAHRGRDVVRVECIETHVSVLFLTEQHVLKLKKPVHLPFVDQSTLARRRTACEAELRLNRRTSPAMYIGLRAIRSGRDGRAYVDTDALLAEVEEGAVAGTPERRARACSPSHLDATPSTADVDPLLDVAVEMVRLPAEQMLDARLARNAVTEAHLRALCALLADFHRRADGSASIAEHGRPERVRRKLLENLDQLAREALPHPDQIEREQLDALRAFITERCAEQSDLLDQRWRGGFVREGHGDLHAGNVCLWDERILIYDCVEFDLDLRTDDVACDVAFLVMDLCHRDHAEQARRITELYAEAAGDVDLSRLVPLYAVHRALIRAKVELFATHQHTGPAAAEHLRTARRYVQLALAWALGPVAIELDAATAQNRALVHELERVERARVRMRPSTEGGSTSTLDDSRDSGPPRASLCGSTGDAVEDAEATSGRPFLLVAASRRPDEAQGSFTLLVDADDDPLDVVGRLLGARIDARRT
jgi:aminoglycoside phosphotransferase family enzyme